MAGSSEIRYTIGANWSKLSKVFTSDIPSAAAVAGKSIERKLGLKDAFKATVLSLGLSIESLSKKFAEIFSGGSAEAWAKGMESAAQSTDLILEKQLSRLDTARQIAALEKEIRANAADEDPKPKESTFNKFTGALFDSPSGRKISRAYGIGGGESDAEAFARSQAAQGRRLKLEKQIEDLKKSGQKTDEQVEESREAANNAALTDEEKLSALRSEAEVIGEKIAATNIRTAEVKELEIERNRKIGEANALDLKIQNDKAAAIERQNKFLEEQSQAQLKVAEAQIKLAQEKHDAVAFGVDEAAGGKRGNTADRERARAILRDEAMSRRLFDSGHSVTQFENGRNVSRGFQFFQDRAEQMRGAFDRTKTSDRDPFAAATAQLVDANQHLTNIENALQLVDTSKGSGKSPAPKSFAGK